MVSGDTLVVRSCARVLLFWAALVLPIAIPSAAQPSPVNSGPPKAIEQDRDEQDRDDREQEQQVRRRSGLRRVIPVRMVTEQRKTSITVNVQPRAGRPPLQQSLPTSPTPPRRVIPVRMVTSSDAVPSGPSGNAPIAVPPAAPILLPAAAPKSNGTIATAPSPGAVVPADPTNLPPVAPPAPPTPRTPRTAGVTPSMRVGRAVEPPVLDGLVSEASWDSADVASDFLQREPQEGQPASERTEVRVLYDDDNLYVGVIAYDENPSAVLATEMRRDELGSRFGGSDDTFSILLDTFNDGRSAFLFTVNALGTRYDATIRNESEINSDWDEAWEAAAQVTARGWEAEMVIPLGILRFSSGMADWGVDFERQIRHKNEQVAWSNYRRNFQFIAVSQAGGLRGFENLSVTQRFRLRPYFLGGATSLFDDSVRTNDVTEEFGIDDLKIQLTSNLTADLTYNTDFAQVEVDQQRVNLTRFSLFFPEKRDFFLEGANNFSFGQQRGGFGGGFGAPTLRLFHSRNIGLSDDGEPTPIDFGFKMTGKLGSGNIGLLNVQTGDSVFGGGRNYSALRWRQDILERSSIGALITNVEGPAGATNTVIGADANFTFFDNLNISAFGARATDDGLEEGKFAGQFRVGWQTDLWSASVDILRIDPEFESDLGFVLRDDIVRRAYRVSWNPRPRVPWMRQVSVDGSLSTFHDSSGTLVSRRAEAFAFFSFESGDSIGGGYAREFELLDSPFEIHPDVTIPPGEYTFDALDVFLFTFGGRRISAGLSANIGEFYDGTILALSPRLTFRLSEKFRLAPSFSYNKIDLPGGSFTSNVFNVRANYSFSDRWLTDALVQHSNVSDEVSIFARLRYIYRIGDDIYLVYRQAGKYDGLRFGRHDRSLTLKVTRSFDW